jgi:hypothetical protein
MAMAPLAIDHDAEQWLEHHTAAWAEAGLISDAEAAAINEFEHHTEPAAPPRLSLIAELATYLGAVIALAGGAAIIGPNWHQLRLGGQLALGLSIALVGFVVGTWLVRLGEPATQRVGSFVRLAGTGGVALTIGVVVHAIDPREQAWYPVTIGAAVLAIGLALWRNRERPLELLTAGAGIAVLAVGVTLWVEPSAWVYSPIAWIGSAAFGVLAAFDRVRPRLVALAMASVGTYAACLSLASVSERTAAIAAVATTVGIAAFATHDRSIPLLVLAILLFFQATTMLMQVVLHGTLARALAVVVGLAVVAYVAIRAQRMSHAP